MLHLFTDDWVSADKHPQTRRRLSRSVILFAILMEVHPDPEIDLGPLRVLSFFYPAWLVFFALSFFFLPILSDVFQIENLVWPILPPFLVMI